MISTNSVEKETGEWQRVPQDEGEVSENCPDDEESPSEAPESEFSSKRLVRVTAALTLTFEGITCFLRFGLGMQSTRDTASTVGRFTFGIRIHHGYIGLMAVLVARRLRHSYPRSSWWIKSVGLSLILSDLIHHFLVLWPLTGSPHFDLVYPK